MQVLAGAPGRLQDVGPARLVARKRFRERRECEPAAVGLRDHRVEPHRALVPPVAEQLGVDRANDEGGPRPRGPVGVGAKHDLLHEVRGMLTRPAVGGVAVVGLAPVRPGPHPVDRLRVVVPIDGVRGVAAVVPHQRNRAPVERDGDRPARRDRLEVVERIGDARLVDAEGLHSGPGEVVLDARPVGALGQPEAASPRPEAPGCEPPPRPRPASARRCPSPAGAAPRAWRTTPTDRSRHRPAAPAALPGCRRRGARSPALPARSRRLRGAGPRRPGPAPRARAPRRPRCGTHGECRA